VVAVGRITAAAALVIAGCAAPLLGNVPQMFQYIQEYTGLVSPGVLAVFLMGLFWKKSTSKAAIIGVIASIPVALLLKTPAVDLPWMDQMFYTLLITMLIIALVSLTSSEAEDDSKAIHLTAATFRTSSVFNLCAYGIILMLVVLYALFW
jgi:SSS family solute:Na+ symporter